MDDAARALQRHPVPAHARKQIATEQPEGEQDQQAAGDSAPTSSRIRSGPATGARTEIAPAMKARTLPLIQNATEASLESGREGLAELPVSTVVAMTPPMTETPSIRLFDYPVCSTAATESCPKPTEQNRFRNDDRHDGSLGMFHPAGDVGIDRILALAALRIGIRRHDRLVECLPFLRPEVLQLGHELILFQRRFHRVRGAPVAPAGMAVPD
jgi:hypothetical protein